MLQLLCLNTEDGKGLFPSGRINGTQQVHQNMSMHPVHTATMALHPEDLHEICHPFQSGLGVGGVGWGARYLFKYLTDECYNWHEQENLQTQTERLDRGNSVVAAEMEVFL